MVIEYLPWSSVTKLLVLGGKLQHLDFKRWEHSRGNLEKADICKQVFGTVNNFQGGEKTCTLD